MKLKIKKKGASKPDSIKVKTGNLMDVFHKMSNSIETDGITRKEAQRRFATALDEDDLMEDWDERSRQSPDTIKSAPPLRFDEPSRNKKGNRSTRKQVESVQKSLIVTRPGTGEMYQLEKPEEIGAQKRLQDLNDMFIFCKAMGGREYQPRYSKHWAEYQGLARKLTSKILTTGGVASGAELIPTILSSQLIPDFRQPLIVASALSHIPMTSSTFESPLEGTEMNAYHVAESTSNDPASTANAIPNANMATGKVTWTARALKVRTWLSTETEEDAIIAALPMLRSNVGRALGGSWEDAVINGDRDSNHIDDDVVDGDNDRRHAINGLRKLVQADARFDCKDSSTFMLKVADFLTGRGKMGQYASDPMSNLLCLTGNIGLVHLVGDPKVQKINEMGADQATLPRGTLAGIFGAPLIVSGKVREDISPTGVNVAAASLNVYTHALQMHKHAFVIGDRREITIKSAEDIQTDRTVVVGTFRGDLQQTYADSSGNRCISDINSVTSTPVTFT